MEVPMPTNLKPGDELVPANFDADLSPAHEVNIRAAAVRRLTYDKKNRVYKDEDGCIVRDRFGQPL